MYTMYKTISINNNTYQQLSVLAEKLGLPKSQVIDDLIREYIERMHEEEKIALKVFNQSVKRLSKQVKLPKGTTINTNNLDSTLSSIILVNEKKP